MDIKFYSLHILFKRKFHKLLYMAKLSYLIENFTI